MPTRRPELVSMSDDYARHALSQRQSFEAIHPAVMAAAGRLTSEPVLRVVDLGAADGVNSHDLIRDLMAQRAGRPLVYALVDLPTNAWRVAAAHLQDAFGPAADQGVIAVIPAQTESDDGVVDVGTGAYYASPEAHGEACRRALDRDPPPAAVISMAGIPLHQAPALPSGTVHIAVTGTTMHWVAEAAGLASSGSVFPGYPDHVDEDERRAWRVAAEMQWEQMLEMRAAELVPAGWFIAAIPASPASCPDRTGLYVEIVGDMNRLLAEWHRAGRIGGATAAAVVVPVWSRTLDEFRAPFEAGGAGSPIWNSRASSFSVSTTLTGTTIPRRSRGTTSRAWPLGEGRSYSARSRARVRHERPASLPTSSESSRYASRRPPTATAGTTSRPSSSVAKTRLTALAESSDKHCQLSCVGIDFVQAAHGPSPVAEDDISAPPLAFLSSSASSADQPGSGTLCSN